ncbi:MAG: hypothetical protein EA398_01520 [Deltaproteobacteria bacterium]|nr:MAG: hypothetical protein EA398_01520 [Deltaproteobacteria bacterium]
MFRIKLIVLFLVVLLGFLGAAGLFLSGVSRTVTTDTEMRLIAAREAVQAAIRLHEYSLVRSVEELAVTPGVIRALHCPRTEEDLEQQRREQTPQLGADGTPVRDALGRIIDTEGRPIETDARFSCATTADVEVRRALAAWNTRHAENRERDEFAFLPDRGLGNAMPREPDLLLVADSQGVVMGRVGHDMEHWFGPSRPNMNQFPVVGRTEAFGVQHDFIAWRDRDSDAPRLAQVAAAPIHGPEVDGERPFLGSVLVGYLVSNRIADDMARLVSETDIAFYFVRDGAISFPGSSLTERERLRQHLGSGPFVTDDGEELDTLGLIQQPGALFRTSFDGREYALISQMAARSEDGRPVAGAMVVTSLSVPVLPVRGAFQNLLLVAFILLLVGVGGSTVVVSQMLKPIEEISKGIQEVIAGNRDYMWPVEDSNYLCDMSHSLNIMSARLQGKPDPDTDEAADAAWGGGGGPSGGAKPAAGAGPKAGASAGGITGLGGLRGRSARKTEDDDSSADGPDPA